MNQITKDSLLQETLENILSSGTWDDSRLTLYLSSTEGKSGKELAMIIERDAKAIINFLERVINDLHDAPSWLTTEEIPAFKKSRFRIDNKDSFIFEIDIAVESLTEMAACSLMKQKASSVHSLRCKSGGEKSSISAPIYEAIKQ